MLYPLEPFERDPRETGLAPLRMVYALEALGCPRRDALCLSPEQAAAALCYYRARARLIDDAIRKVAVYA